MSVSLLLTDDEAGYLLALVRRDVRRHQRTLDNFAVRPGQDPEEATRAAWRMAEQQRFRRRLLNEISGQTGGGHAQVQLETPQRRRTHDQDPGDAHPDCA